MFSILLERFLNSKSSSLGALDDRQWCQSSSAFCTISDVCVWTGSGCRTLYSNRPASKAWCAMKIWVFPRKWRCGWTLERCPAGESQTFLMQNYPSPWRVVFAGTGSTVLRFLSRWWMAVVVAMGNFPDASTMRWSGLASRSNREALRMRRRRVASQTAAWAPAARLSAPFPSSNPTQSPKRSQPLATPTVSIGYVFGPSYWRYYTFWNVRNWFFQILDSSQFSEFSPGAPQTWLREKRKAFAGDAFPPHVPSAGGPNSQFLNQKGFKPYRPTFTFTGPRLDKYHWVSKSRS